MSAITKPIILDETGARIASALEAIAIGGTIDPDASWEQVRNVVRAGLGAKAFPVGTQFVTAHTVFGDIIWDVVAHGNYVNPASGTPCMTLCAHDTISSQNVHEFDAQEALVYSEAGLAAGTYIVHLTDGYDTSHGGGANYSFTLTQALPAGGHICISWANNQSPASVTTYSGADSTTAIETATLTATESAATITAGVNHAARARFGSNHYGESNIRQWLNSEAAAGEWFSAQTVYDRMPGYSAAAGFLAGFGADFKAVLCAADVKVNYNTTYNEGGTVTGYYTLRDKVFLPSGNEVDLRTDSNEGSPMQYFDDNTLALVKYSGSSRALWWLRTAVAATAYQAYLVRSSTQTTQGTNACMTGGNYGVSPMLNIG